MVKQFQYQSICPVLEYAGYTVTDSAGNNNGKIDPGETVVITVRAKNTGSSRAYSVAGLLTPDNSFLSVLTGTQNYGTIDSNQVISASFTAVADPDAAAGQPVVMTFALTGEHGITGTGTFTVVIGQIPVLIVDLDKNHNSADKILTSIQNLGVNAQLVTAFPDDLSLYSSLFVCLGTYSQNYKLTAADGLLLADYLNNGGMIYMEGGDTWCYDSVRAVHPMFHIGKVADGTGDLNVIVGQPGTMVDGMSFTFAGENNYIDQITAVSPGVMMFKNTTPSYGTTVCFQNEVYRTIGSSFEFGGLTDGTGSSCKDSLMSKMLHFFGLSIIPVELTSFEAEIHENTVQLKWKTATEVNNMGFDIERSRDGNLYETIGHVKGSGTTTELSQYSFIDQSLNGSGITYYRLRQIDYDGTSSYSQIIEVDYSSLPTEFSLSQNYPNPFNPSTTIKFALPKEVRVTLKIYDALGSEVETVVSRNMEAGYHQIEWNAGKYSSGMYIYRITAGNYTSVKKMMILK
jgi:hypothetical protein